MRAQKSDALRLMGALAGVGILAGVFAAASPRAVDSIWQLVHEDDPSALASRRLDGLVSETSVARGIADAMGEGDVDLANSFAELARDRGIAVAPAQQEALAAANATGATAARAVRNFAHGFVAGTPDDAASFAGTAVGDLLVFGDLRDAYRETSKLAHGEPADELVLGLAFAGIAITAGTYASLGTAAPARASLTLVKAARRTGRLSTSMGSAVTRALRETVDLGAVRRAVTQVSLRDPAVAVRAMRDAVKVERAGTLARMTGDIGKVGASAGTRAALDGLKLARGPRELSRLARLAEKEGGKTRAVLKILGRSAIALAFITFEASSWLFGTVMALFGFCAAVKAAAEGATWRYVRWRKRRRPGNLPAIAAVA
jgi:hypothetical protein